MFLVATGRLTRSGVYQFYIGDEMVTTNTGWQLNTCSGEYASNSVCK